MAPILMASLTSRLYVRRGKRGGLWLLGGKTSIYTVVMELLAKKKQQTNQKKNREDTHEYS